jgi:hypothetical protein
LSNFSFFFCPNFSLLHFITPTNFSFLHPKVLIFLNRLHGCKKCILITCAKKANDEKCECWFIINGYILCFVCVFRDPPKKNLRLGGNPLIFICSWVSTKNHLCTWRFPYLWVLMKFKNTL